MNEAEIDTAAQVTDPLELPRGPITRARAKKFKEALLNLMKTNYLKAFEDDEMKVELIFYCHNYSKEKKVKIVVIEFTDYAIN